jgi:hypothetical protein
VWREPDYNQWFNNYGLSITNREIGRVTVATIATYTTKIASTIALSTVTGISPSGAIVVNGEQMRYDSIDRVNNLLLGVTRGINSTITVHPQGSRVEVDMPAVLVLDTGRAYTEVPVVTAYIDTSVYPVPRVAATFTPIMASDRLIGIAVTNPGDGYAVQPQIRISPASIAADVNATAFNLSFNTITIPDHNFLTGDCVTYVSQSGTLAPVGLDTDTYYYVRKIDSDTVALYTTYRAAVTIVKSQLEIDDRVEFITAGTGQSYLSVSARAIAYTASSPVREMKTALKFDRTSYTSKVTPWQPGAFYAGEYTNIVKQSSSSLNVSNTLPFAYLSWDTTGWSADLLASAQGSVLPIAILGSSKWDYGNS